MLGRTVIGQRPHPALPQPQPRSTCVGLGSASFGVPGGDATLIATHSLVYSSSTVSSFSARPIVRPCAHDQLWMLRAHLDDHEPGCEKGRLTRRPPEPPLSTVSGTPSAKLKQRPRKRLDFRTPNECL